MKFPALTLCALFAFATPAFAQTAVPPTAPATPPTPAAAPAAVPMTSAPTSSGPALDKQGRPKAKEVRQECRADAKSQGLKGDDRFKAVSACVLKQRPDLAAKEQCRMDGHAKGLKKDDLKAFVKDCAKGKA